MKPSTTERVARGPDAWKRSYPFWDAYFGVALVGTVAIVVLDSGPSAATATAIGLLLALTLAYLLSGRKAARGPGRPTRDTYVYLVAMTVLFVPATVIAPAAAFGLCALAPQLYMSVRAPAASAVLAVLCSGAAFHWITQAGLSPWIAIAILGVLVGCATVLGLVIDRLGEQNAERARLITELDRTRDELASVSRRAGILAERERLARDIHDTVAQGLGGISMLLQAAEAETGSNAHLTLARDAARNNLAEVRSLVSALAPPPLAEGSLDSALAELARNGTPPAELTIGESSRSLDPATDAVLLRIAQESITNIGKHARAGSATMVLDYGMDEVTLMITDDGDGLEPAAPSGGYGLRGMRARVEQAGGTLTVNSSPGHGTVITAVLPC